jgi:glucose 1-dehydrogenase
MKIDGQAALVTGGDSGIGAEVCRVLAANGARVGINYHVESTAADALCEEIHAHGGEAIAVKADVSSEDEVGAMFDRFAAAFGRIDILVANAGIQIDAPVIQMSLAAWRRVLEVNLTGQFLCAREAIRRFREQTPSTVSRSIGKVICMSSVHEVIPWAGHVNYAASKGGVQLMMKTLAQEVARHRIRVNGIAPGMVPTKMTEVTVKNPARAEATLRQIPLGRFGSPEDMAGVALFLASPMAAYVVGQTIIVDGGLTL